MSACLRLLVVTAAVGLPFVAACSGHTSPAAYPCIADPMFDGLKGAPEFEQLLAVQ